MAKSRGQGSPHALAARHCVVVGLGGLGHPVLAGLLASGVRRFTLIDHDRVEPSNLHRQWLFTPADRGRLKVDSAASWLLSQDRTLEIHRRSEALDPQALRLPAGTQQMWFEGSDQPTLKFALARLAMARNVPLVIGGVLGWQGQVFSQAPVPGCYACLFYAPPPHPAQTCAQAGVFTTAAARVGLQMVASAAALCGPAPAPNGIWHLDLRTLRAQTMRSSPRPDCPSCGRGLAPRAKLR